MSSLPYLGWVGKFEATVGQNNEEMTCMKKTGANAVPVSVKRFGNIKFFCGQRNTGALSVHLLPLFFVPPPPAIRVDLG